KDDPQVFLTANEYQADDTVEGQSTEVALFRLNTGFSQTGIPLTVNYAVSGTATPGADYEELSGQVTVPTSPNTVYFIVAGSPAPAETYRANLSQIWGNFCIVVDVFDDTVYEPEDETITLTLLPGHGYEIYAEGWQSTTATVRIRSDDPPPVISVE